MLIEAELKMATTTLRNRTGRTITVRRFTPPDRASLQAFYEDFEPKRGAQGLPPHDSDSISRWLDGILAEGTHLLAVFEDELVGHAFMAPMSTPCSAEYAIFVRADFRGQGLGTELTRRAIEAATERGYRRLWLSVEPRNRPAIRSYIRAGFRFLPNTIYTPEAEMELLLGDESDG